MIQKRTAILPTVKTVHLADEKRIFDLRAEYALTAVKLGLIAERYDRILALSIDPVLPRYFVGNPRPLRKIFTRLVETALLAVNVDIVTVRIENVGLEDQETNKVKLSVTANGPGLSPATLHILQQPALFSPHYTTDENSSTLFTINEQIRRLGGRLHVESLHGWGTRYVIDFQLTKFAAHQIYANAS